MDCRVHDGEEEEEGEGGRAGDEGHRCYVVKDSVYTSSDRRMSPFAVEICTVIYE